MTITEQATDRTMEAMHKAIQRLARQRRRQRQIEEDADDAEA